MKTQSPFLMEKESNLIFKEELKKIEEYLKQDELNSNLMLQGKVFLKSIEAIKEEMEPIKTKIDSINDKLKGFDFLDYIHSRDFKRDLKVVNRIIQDLKIFESEFYGNEEYQRKWKVVYERVVEVGNEIVSEKIENEIESFYLNNDFVTYVVLLEAKEEVMEMVIEKRRRICSRKIKHYIGEKEVFFKMLINQEIFLWSMLFPDDLNNILSRLVDQDLPLGYSKFERVLFEILCVFFRDHPEGAFSPVDKNLIRSFLDENERLKVINNYPEIGTPVIDWFYNSLLYKSNKEYLNDGVIDL